LRRWEWRQQIIFAGLLSRWLPNDGFFSAFDPVAGNALSGWLRRRRGVRAGAPDNWVLYRGRLICVELKSPGGKCSRAQRETRLAILAAGGEWWEARSANAGMAALAASGVVFREIDCGGGLIVRWRQPALADWERPRRDPSSPLAMHPQVLAERREARRRWRERKRLKAAVQAVERDDGAGPARGAEAWAASESRS
jgi:hypothetical protein